RYNPEEVRKRYNLEPNQIVDLKALVGDPSDNIKGLAGVGEKGATKLLQDWGNLESAYENRSQLTPKLRQALESCQDQIALNKNLVTLRYNAPMQFNPDSCNLESA